MQKPDVDYIEGIPPAISVEQKTASHNPRSIVGTVTEIYDYLRLLFAHVGVPYCPEHRIPCYPVTVDEIVDRVLTNYAGERIYVLAPVVRGKKGEQKKLIEQIAKMGYTKVFLDDILYDVDEPVEIDKNQRHTLEVVTDRLTVRLRTVPELPMLWNKLLSLQKGSWQSRPRRVRSILASRWLAPYVVGLY